MKPVVMKIALLVLLTLGAAHFASAGWFDDAVERAKQRVGTRAVDQTADGAYDAAKDAVLNKNKGGAKETAQPRNKSSVRSPERSRPAEGMAGEAIDDDHFIQKDDYFVSKTPLEKRTYIYVSLSKMVTEPSARTKGEAEFFKVTDGSNFWSKHYYQSRIAGDGEIKLGTQVIIFEGHSDGGVYHAPETKESARGGNWFLAKVTDTSDMYRGFVTVSGNYKIDVNNLRVLTPKTQAPVRVED